MTNATAPSLLLRERPLLEYGAEEDVLTYLAFLDEHGWHASAAIVQECADRGRERFACDSGVLEANLPCPQFVLTVSSMVGLVETVSESVGNRALTPVTRLRLGSRRASARLRRSGGKIIARLFVGCAAAKRYGQVFPSLLVLGDLIVPQALQI